MISSTNIVIKMTNKNYKPNIFRTGELMYMCNGKIKSFADCTLLPKQKRKR